MKDKVPEICNLCGFDKFNVMDGFYFCNGCGSQSQALREFGFESELAHTRGLQKSTKKAEKKEKEPKASSSIPVETQLVERARKYEDFPQYLLTIGYRLCTFTKLVVKISETLVTKHKVPPTCTRHSIWIMQTYLRKFGCAFCEEELGDGDDDLYEPLLLRSAPEIKRMKREAAKKAAENIKEMEDKRFSKFTGFEQLTEDFKKSSEPAEIDVMNQIRTKLSAESIKSAAYIYLEIDMILAVVYCGALLSGCQWIQLSDLFRWYREGRFAVSKSQIRALYPSLEYRKENNSVPLRRRGRYHYNAVQPLSENLRVIAFLTQFTEIPKAVRSMDFSMVLSRMIYNLGLPNAFFRHVSVLYKHLPEVDVECGAKSSRRQLPIFANCREKILRQLCMGPTTFMRIVFENGSLYESAYRMAIAVEVKAVALILFALKLCFGLDDRREYTMEVLEPDCVSDPLAESDAFNYREWFTQLKLRLNVWQGKPIATVLSQGFFTKPDPRSSKKIKHNAWSTRHLRFLKCVPNRVNYPYPGKFANLFHESTPRCSTNDALFAPLRFQALHHENLLSSSTITTNTDEDLDRENVEIFFKSFTDSHMNFREAEHPPNESSYDNIQEDSNSALATELFPCANHYTGCSAVANTFAEPTDNEDECGGGDDGDGGIGDGRGEDVELKRRTNRSAVYKTHAKMLLEVSRHSFSKSFADLLYHFATIVGETEELVFYALLTFESAVFDKATRVADKFAVKKPLK